MYTLEEINAANILISLYHNRHYNVVTSFKTNDLIICNNCGNHVHIGLVEIHNPKDNVSNENETEL